MIAKSAHHDRFSDPRGDSQSPPYRALGKLRRVGSGPESQHIQFHTHGRSCCATRDLSHPEASCTKSTDSFAAPTSCSTSTVDPTAITCGRGCPVISTSQLTIGARGTKERQDLSGGPTSLSRPGRKSSAMPLAPFHLSGHGDRDRWRIM